MKKGGVTPGSVRYFNKKNIDAKEGKNKISFKGIIKNYFDFYKRELRKKHIIIYIISLIIFAMFTNTFISDLNTQNSLSNQLIDASNKVNSVQNNVLSTIVKEKIPLAAILVFAGITPYLYISAIGLIFAPYVLARDIGIVIRDATGTSSILSLSISSVLQLLGISLAIVTGIYYCYNGTKRFRYSQFDTMGIDDIKDQYYQIRKDEKKLEQLRLKRQQKAEKKEKLNVKIEYLNILVSTAISIIIVSISTLITIF